MASSANIVEDITRVHNLVDDEVVYDNDGVFSIEEGS